MGRQEVTDLVEGSDCLLMLGSFLTDINLGIFTANLDPRRCIDATSESIKISHHSYADVRLDDFIIGLRERELAPQRTPFVKRRSRHEAWVPQGASPVTVARLFQRLDLLLGEGMVVIADIGDSLFGAADLTMTPQTDFVSPAYYTSMGFALPACVGVGKATPERRALVIVGDGAFQMTGMELSTVVRQHLNPIVVVLNNHGYTTERFLLEGSFNDIQEWQFHKIPEVLGAGLGIEVRTEEELDAALGRAVEHASGFTLLNVHLDPWDKSPALERLATRLASVVRGEPATAHG